MKKLLLLLLFVSFAAQGQDRIDPRADGYENNVLTIHQQTGLSIHYLPVEYTVVGEEYQGKMLNYFWPRIGTVTELNGLYPVFVLDGSNIIPRVGGETLFRYFETHYRVLNTYGKRMQIGGRIDDVSLVLRRSNVAPNGIWGAYVWNIEPEIRVGDVVRLERFGSDTQHHFDVEDVFNVFERPTASIPDHFIYIHDWNSSDTDRALLDTNIYRYRTVRITYDPATGAWMLNSMRFTSQTDVINALRSIFS